jgi:hypothetical protein
MSAARHIGSVSEFGATAKAMVGQFIWRAAHAEASISDHLLAETAIAVLQAAIHKVKRTGSSHRIQKAWRAAMDDLNSLESARQIFQKEQITRRSGKILALREAGNEIFR